MQAIRETTATILTHEPPSWVSDYIGLDYRHNGRGRDGVDCWGLARLVYRDRFGISLPTLAGEKEHSRARAEAPRAQLFRPAALPLRVGDLVEIPGTRPGALHVGILVAEGLMLHAWERTASCLERIDTPVWQPRIGGVHRYSAAVSFAARPNPFRAEQILRELPAGVSILELLELASIAPLPGVHVHVDGRLVPSEAWGMVRPKAGRVVNVSVQPLGGGGGKSALRLVATIGIIVAAAYTGGAAASALTAAGYGAGATAAGAAIASGAVMAGGYFALNALVPPTSNRLGASSAEIARSPWLEGARNEIRQYAPFPVPFGDVRFAPPMGAVPYTEAIGDKQYLRCLFVMMGPVDLSEFRIGDTPLSEHEGVEIEIRNGFDGELPCSLYPSTIVEQSLSILLEQVDGWTTRTSAINADELSVDLTWPQGLVEFGAAGDRIARTVTVQVQYRKVDDVAWRNINDGGASPSYFRELDYLFRTPEASFGGEGVHVNDINWSANTTPYPDAKPGYLPASWYAWEAQGAIYAPTAGTYHFCVDGSDACDVHVNWKEVASFYGSHDPEVTQATLNSSTHTGSIQLAKGWHVFRARVESRSGGAGGGALAVGWKKPGDSVFTIVPQANFGRPRDVATYGSGYIAGELNYRWFSNAAYESELTVTDSASDTIRKNISWPVEQGQYEVRVQRVTADASSDQVLDEVYWTALKTIRTADPVKQRNVAKIALRILATDQLNGTLDTFNVRARSIVPDWDAATSSWIVRPSSNCASLFRWVAQGSAIAEPWPDAEIDLAALQALHADGYTFDAVIDQEGTVWDRLSDIASCARATAGLKDGKLTVVPDRVKTTPVQLFTPRNSFGFRGRKAWVDVPHALRVQYMNRELEYKQDERLVFADGYTEENATRFETMSNTGLVDPDAIWKRGRYDLAQMILRPEVYELGTDAQHLVCNRGDMVRIAHDVLSVGYVQGRVTRLIVDTAGNCKGVIVDEPCPMASGDDHAIRFRLSDNEQILVPVVTVEGKLSEIRFTVPIPAANPQPAVGDLYAFGLAGVESRDCIVKAIRMSQDLAATLELVDHAPAVHTADEGEIPPYDSGVTQIPDYLSTPEAPVIESIRSDDSVLVRGPDGSAQPRILITLRPQSGLRPMANAINVRWRPLPVGGGDAQGPFRSMTLVLANSQVSIPDVEQGIEYQIRLRYVTATGIASAWTEATHTVVGKTGIPPDVVSFDVRRLSDGTRQFVWDLGVEPADVAGVLIRFGDPGDPWEDLQPLVNGIIEGASPWDTPLPPTGGLKRFAIKMVDTSGLESATALFVEKDLGVPPQENVVISEDAHAAMWPGTRTDCFYTTGGVLEANDTTTWATLPATWTGWTRWNMNPTSPIRYTHTTIDVGVVFNFEPVAYVLADGAAVVEVAWSEVSSSPSNWTAINTLANQTIRARYVQFRVTVTATGGQPVPVIRELLMQLRAPIIHIELNDLDTSSLDTDHKLGVGDIRLPIPAGMFTQVRRVSLSFNGVGVGWTWEVVDKDPSLGPRVRLYDTDGNPAHAVVDAVIRGL